MSNELIGVIIGGIIALFGSVITTWLAKNWEFSKRRDNITGMVKAELTAARDMSLRFIDGESTLREMQNATPLWKSLPSDVSFLKKEQIVAARKAITLHFELEVSGDKDKARMCISACEEALKLFS